MQEAVMSSFAKNFALVKIPRELNEPQQLNLQCKPVTVEVDFPHEIEFDKTNDWFHQQCAIFHNVRALMSYIATGLRLLQHEVSQQAEVDHVSSGCRCSVVCFGISSNSESTDINCVEYYLEERQSRVAAATVAAPSSSAATSARSSSARSFTDTSSSASSSSSDSEDIGLAAMRVVGQREYTLCFREKYPEAATCVCRL